MKGQQRDYKFDNLQRVTFVEVALFLRAGNSCSTARPIMENGVGFMSTLGTVGCRR